MNDTFTYGVANSACDKGQQNERELDLLAETQGLGHELDVTTYNAAISVREKGKQPDRALELPTEIPPGGEHPPELLVHCAVTLLFV